MRYLQQIWESARDKYLAGFDNEIGAMARRMGFRPKPKEPTIPLDMARELIGVAYVQGAKTALMMAGDVDQAAVRLAVAQLRGAGPVDARRSKLLADDLEKILPGADPAPAPLTVKAISAAMIGNDWWLFPKGPEAQIVRRALEAGFLRQFAYTQIEWTKEGLAKARALEAAEVAHP